MIHTHALSRAVAATVAVIAALVPAAVSAVPDGYAITLTTSAASAPYGDSPTFRVTVTVPVDEHSAGNVLPNIDLVIDGQRYGGDAGGTPPTLTLVVRSLSPAPAVGQHSVVAEYVSPKVGTITSDPVTLTVVRRPTQLTCGFPSVLTIAGAPLSFPVTLSEGTNGYAPGGTFGITFSGGQTFTRDGLVQGASWLVNTTAPTVPDVYHLSCSFSGTATLAPAEQQWGSPLTVSAGHATGAIRLRTDPAPVTAGVPITWDVTVPGAAGLPAPTGYVSIRVGSAFTHIIPLEAGGHVRFDTTPYPFSGSAILVSYQGDTVYGPTITNLTFDTPPISGGTSAPPGGGGAASAPGAGGAAGAAGAAAPAGSADSPAATAAGEMPEPAAPQPSMPATGTQPPTVSAAPLVVTRLAAASAGGRWRIGAAGLAALFVLGGAALVWLRRRRSAANPS